MTSPAVQMPPPTSSARQVLSGRFLRVTAANFCFFMTFASFFLLPLRVRELGGDDRMVGFVMGSSGAAGLVGVLVVGAMIDRIGCRLFLRAGMAGMALISLSFAFVDRIGVGIVALRALQGVAFAAGFNAASTLAATFAPRDRRATALGFFGVSTLITHALAPTLGEQIVRISSFPVLFAVASGFSFVGLVVAWTLPDATVDTHAAHRTQASLAAGLPASLATSACCGVAFGSVIAFVPTFTLDAHLGPVATFFLSYTAIAILTRTWAGRVADDFGLRRMIVPGIAILAGAILALAAVHTTIGLAAAGMAFGLAQGVVYPTLNAFSVDLAGEGQLGRVQALYNGTFNIGITSGSLGFGPIVQSYGHRVMFACASGVAMLALLVFQTGTRRVARS
jgi:MFS family permease